MKRFDPKPTLGDGSFLRRILPQSRRAASRRRLSAQSFPQEWESVLLSNVAHYGLLSKEEQSHLRNDARILLVEKQWEGCGGLKMTDEIRLTIAAQAALMLLGLKNHYFSRVLSIVVFPSEFELPKEEWEDETAKGQVVDGQAVNYGPVILSWDTVLAEGQNPSMGHNLVIHEFAHQLDFLDGYTNGVPPLKGKQQFAKWRQTMTAEFTRLRRDFRKGRDTFLGDYAATNAGEFFSVASERFFMVPMKLRHYHGKLYHLLAESYRVDPVRWFAGRGQ